MQIRLDVRNLKAVQDFLKSLPRGTIRAAIVAMSEYFLGNDQRGLRHYPPRVKHGEGNPYQWQSEKQRKAYFATDGFGGGIPSKRTGELKESWEAKYANDGYTARLENKSPRADYVQGFQQQRGHFADKWRKARDIIFSNMNGAMLSANRAVKQWIKEKEVK